jgi:TadE-like protein
MSAAPALARRARPRRSVGQALVEFCLVIPIFLVVLCGLFDGARLVYMNSVLSQAGREAARVASVEASWVGSTKTGCNTAGGPVCPASFDALLADANAAANRMVTPFAAISIASIFMSCDAKVAPTGAWTTRSCNTRSTGSLVSVRVIMTYTAITPLIGLLIPPIHLSGYATMVID